MKILLKLKLFWLFLITLTIVIPTFLYLKYPKFAFWETAIFILGSLEAVFTSALFSQKDNILVRGVMEAFGFKWQEVHNISQRSLGFLKCLFGDLYHKDTELNIKQAKLLYPLPNQNTWYAILRNRRHGIPDPQTLKKIWSNDELKKARKWDLRRLEKTELGQDLLSEQYWKK